MSEDNTEYVEDSNEGFDGGFEATNEGGGAEETPSYLFGDVTPDEAADRFGYLRELPDNLRGLESRVESTIAPLFDQLNGIGERIGSQPVFEPKLEKFAAALAEYDPKLAESALPALIEDLKNSMSVTPLGPESLSPHINPMLEQQQQAVMDQMVPALLETLPFDPDTLVNLDPSNPDRVLEPESDLQKDFAKWWEQSDAPTRKALSVLGVPYVSALQKFGKWRAGQMRKKGEAVGNASARLSSATQSGNRGRRENAPRGLQTEADGFNSVFKK